MTQSRNTFALARLLPSFPNLGTLNLPIMGFLDKLQNRTSTPENPPSFMLPPSRPRDSGFVGQTDWVWGPPMLRSTRLTSHPPCLRAGIELFRLEQRYTRRKHRSAFVSEAQYVDGEYIYHAGQNQRGRGSGKDPRNVTITDVGDGSRR